MKVGSLFAGIGGFDLGFERAGFHVAWCVEIDKHARAVLARRFPKARILEDVTKVDPHDLESVDVICGGFPCQDLSVAGKRAGLAGARSGLFHDAMRIVRTVRPRLLVLENVPGLLSSNRGLDFATVLREVGEGWNCEEVGWRVLDSQYFGVAQRRRRVFVVAGSRIGCAEEVLALAESSGGNPPTRGEAREGVAVDAARCADGGRKFIYGGGSQDTSDTVTSKWHKGSDGPAGNETGLFVAQPFSPHGHYRYEASDQASTLQSRENRQGGHTHLIATGDTRTIHAIATPMIVRRLTSVECERLQGFPDGWTDIGTPEKPTADSHRYKQLGNAVTVNVAEWIARRAHDALSKEAQ